MPLLFGANVAAGTVVLSTYDDATGALLASCDLTLAQARDILSCLHCAIVAVESAPIIAAGRAAATSPTTTEGA